MDEYGTVKDYTPYLQREMPNSLGEHIEHFSIEISIVMRKPIGHYSRANAVVFDILNTFGGGTFFQGQGYWKGHQEPIIYLMISTLNEAGWVIDNLKKYLKHYQSQCLQEEIFVKINGAPFIGSMLTKSETEGFPDQWEFDSEMNALTANQSRIDENHKLIQGRIEYNHNKNYSKARDIFRELISEFADYGRPLENNQKRDLIKCYSNILSKKIEGIDYADKERMFTQLIELLPLHSDSVFSDEELSKHAEARIRGNRINLYSVHGFSTVSSGEMIKDGIFAISQIANHLRKGRYLYLDKDPILDIRNIITQIGKLSPSSENMSQIRTLCEEIANSNPYYDIENLLGLDKLY